MKIKRMAGLLLVVASISWGCSQSGSEAKKSEAKESVKKEEVKSTAKTGNQQGKVDKHGRKPGDAHYGHDHGKNEAHGGGQATTPTSGGPDQHGRMPGDEHYGHGHP